MTNDIERAKKIFSDDDYTCVLCKGDLVYTSRLTGIEPMVHFINEGIDLHGFAAADKIVGKAAALLFVHAGVSSVYAGVMSEGARSVFIKYSVAFSCGELAVSIINRTGTGLCPMEDAVIDISSPEEAFAAVTQKLAMLKKASGYSAGAYS